MKRNIAIIKFGESEKYQKGEDKIACTFDNADLAVSELLKKI